MQVSLDAWRTFGWVTLYLGLTLALSSCSSQDPSDLDAIKSAPEAKQGVAQKPVDSGEAQERSTTVSPSLGEQEVASEQVPEDLDEEEADLKETGASDPKRRSELEEEGASPSPKRSSRSRGQQGHKAKKKNALRDDEVGSEIETPAPPAPPAPAASAPMPETTLGGVREPSLYRAQVKSAYLPVREKGAERVEALKRVDLSAHPLTPLSPSTPGDCARLEKIEEILSFVVLERLDQWGVNASLTGFAQDSEGRLKGRLSPSTPHSSHLKVSLRGRGLGEHCLNEGRLNIRGVIELNTAAGERLFQGGATVTYRGRSTELSTPKRQARHVRRLIQEWRDQLVNALKLCLTSASKMEQKHNLKLKSSPQVIDETTPVTCLVDL